MNLETLIKEKCTLKELGIYTNLKTHDFTDMLFLTSYGYIIGTPYVEPDIPETAEVISSYIILSNVVIVRDDKATFFNGKTFFLYVDQIIATSPIDRDSFLQQLK